MDLISCKFISDFLGYGNKDCEICIIGIKERGDGTNEDTVARINSWEHCGKKQVVDAGLFISKYDAINPGNPTMKDKCRSNKTWNRINVLSNSIYDARKDIITTLSSTGNICNVNIQGIPKESIKSTSEFGATLNLSKCSELQSVRIKNINSLIKAGSFKMIIFHGEDSWSERNGLITPLLETKTIFTKGSQSVTYGFSEGRLIIKCKHFAYISNDALKIISDLWKEKL